jgi:flagellar hook-associated protein 3 FlgL
MIGTTYSARLSSLTQAASTLSTEISSLQEQATTGLSITKPSDAPEQVEYLHGVSSQLADQGVWSVNAERAMSYLDTAEDALDSMSDVLNAARELATQYASETYSADDRADGAVEAQALLDQLVGLANTDLGGRYIFAGNAFDAEAFDATGTYLGDTDAPVTNTSSNQEVATGFVGSELLQGDTDIFAAISDLITALTADDTDAIAASIDTLALAGEQISSARTTVAAEFNAASDAATVAENMSVLLSEAIETRAGADMVSVYTSLSELQSNYEAILQITASSQSMNLFSMM